jgi:hypothetical protein
MLKGFTSLGAVEKGQWLIQASVYKSRILITMFNYANGNCYTQYLDNEYHANLFVEYVLEKG